MRILSDTDLPQLPSEARELVSQGIYSLYALDDAGAGAMYLLLTDVENEFYFLDLSGSVTAKPRGVAELSDVGGKQPVTFAMRGPVARLNFG